MLVILIIFDVNKSHVTILSALYIVAVVKYLHNLIICVCMCVCVCIYIYIYIYVIVNVTS